MAAILFTRVHQQL